MVGEGKDAHKTYSKAYGNKYCKWLQADYGNMKHMHM